MKTHANSLIPEINPRSAWNLGMAELALGKIDAGSRGIAIRAMKTLAFCCLFTLGLARASAAIEVNFYSGFDNLPLTLLSGQIDLDNATGLDSGYARIDNLAHVEFEGASTIGFMRFRYGEEECGYFYRSSNRDNEDPILSGYESIETWGSVHWRGAGSLVDGAQWGSDNYILMRNAQNTVVAVLQFNFQQSSPDDESAPIATATLIASAIDLDGLTFTDGVNAILGIAIPESSSFAVIAGVAGFGFAALRRRRRV